MNIVCSVCEQELNVVYDCPCGHIVGKCCLGKGLSCISSKHYLDTKNNDIAVNRYLTAQLAEKKTYNCKLCPFQGTKHNLQLHECPNVEMTCFCSPRIKQKDLDHHISSQLGLHFKFMS